MDSLQHLLDHHAVVDVVNGVAVFADARRWPDLRACYADTVAVDYSSFTGLPAADVRADDLITGWQTGLSRYQATQHLLTNHRVTLRGDDAHCLVYVQAKHWLPQGDDAPSWTVHGHYDYDLARTGDGWRITRHMFTATMVYGSRALLEMQGVASRWLR